jgi:hypothetical protein
MYCHNSSTYSRSQVTRAIRLAPPVFNVQRSSLIDHRSTFNVQRSTSVNIGSSSARSLTRERWIVSQISGLRFFGLIPALCRELGGGQCQSGFHQREWCRRDLRNPSPKTHYRERQPRHRVTGDVVEYMPRHPISLVLRCSQATGWNPNGGTSSSMKSKAASSDTARPSEVDTRSVLFPTTTRHYSSDSSLLRGATPTISGQGHTASRAE